MLDINKTFQTGRLTRDPESTTLPDGTTAAKFSIAVNKRWKNRDGDWNEMVSYLDVEAFRKTAEFASQWLKKGTAVYVEGSLKQDRWEAKDGTKRSRVTIIADRLQFAESKAEAEGGRTEVKPDADSKPAPQPKPEATQDDLPF